MSTHHGPREALVAIMGTTGTGKSDLAVDLAVRFNGEIINADAMQMYKGLPIITNQISAEEQRGVPHHLLATVDIDLQPWTVGVFAREATRLIREIRSRGKLPIVVGGTHYYISSLLFANTLVDPPEEDGESTYMSQFDIEQQHPILNGPTDLILKRLTEVDPVMAARWHPDDRRKIRRSLEIFLTTGRKASDIYEDQQKAKAASIPTDRPWHALMFWVYSNPDVLKARLDKRVDKMELNGLMDEVRQLHENLSFRKAAGEEVDRTRGIWQSIGFKQFEPFLIAEGNGATTEDLSKLKAESMELTKIATRQYARYQLRWLRTKTIPELRENNATKLLFALDSSEAPKFVDNVLSPAANITQAYLDGLDLPDPASVSTTARDIFSTFVREDQPKKTNYEPKLCDVCNMTLQTPDQWTKHVNGQRHRRGLKHRSRTTLVAIHRPEEASGKEASIVSDGVP
ncbi:putative tRNA isopentenyltransferase [Seiridium unicorne]|uniref:tRNA dimethylallyltransferase n=1 Tax=Seiridium unicorne TaxID=138068 RepID=A0ABR2VHH7_9PEZI